MQPNPAPASAGELFALAPNSTGQPHADDPAVPAGSRTRDTAAPAVSTASAHASAETSQGSAQALARLIAEGRRSRSTRFAELEPYRDVLLAERRAGASIRLLAESLAKLGVTISVETLRVWLLKEKMPKRRRPRKKPVTAKTPLFPAMPAANLPAKPPLSFLPRKGPRIARDNY
jgi:hypothetical protein